MESKEDNSVPSDETDVSQQDKIVNSPENNDNIESCVENIVEENKELDESQPDNDTMEKVDDELCTVYEETTRTVSEEDLPPSNMEKTNDHAEVLETTNMETNNCSTVLENVTNLEEPKNDNVTCLETTTSLEPNDHTTCLETTMSMDISDHATECSEMIGIDDRATCLESMTAENDTCIEKSAPEKSTEVATSQESNAIESSDEGNTSVDADKETEATSNVSNLTKTCDIDQLANIEVSHEDADNTANDGTKLSDETAASELEISSQEKSKDCDIPDESSVNADDLQISQKELGSFKKLESYSSDSNLENPDKECSLSEKNIEPENTEFVQISHDKQDDTQIENQSMDAEDPFGGDNLTENVEQIETDNLVEGEVSFKNIYEQDNLQDEENVKNDNCDEKLDVNYTSNEPKDSTVDKDVDNTVEAPINIQRSTDSLNTPTETDLTNDDASKTDAKSTSPVKSPDDQGGETKKNIEEITPMTTDVVEQTDVLPGQDDELCIIPDSMKVIIPDKSVKVVENEQSESADVQDSNSKDDAAQKSSKSDSDVVKDTVQDEVKSIDAENTSSSTESATTVIENKDAETTEDVAKATDVINIDDEMKNSEEVEEITIKELCKQCNEEKVCKFRVKIGSESYNVCSKTCKALFKAANNKSVDIPSGSHLDESSKREKRCATCCSIIELSEERNLSWETMEFCNDDCLGKFQRKYGSFCKNCNGSVQAVSLGKYCVRFGCDVRQFCCSTCLEEFKKGLKVCSYCQKDISLSTDGFLAPVGEKGQFKDFCTQDCMEKYSKLNSSEPPATEKKPCSVCQEV